MKKTPLFSAVFAVFLSAVLFTLCIPSVLAAEESAGQVTVDLWDEIGGTPVDLSGSEESTMGCQFVTAAPALSVQVNCPTWNRPSGGFITLSLYAFDTDYDKSVAGKPVAEKRYDGFDDNQWISLDFDAEPLKPGEYVLLLHEPEPGQQSGVWLDKASPKQICYNDGIPDPEHSLRARVIFKDQHDNYLGTPSEAVKQTADTPSGELSDAPNSNFTVIFNDYDWLYIVSPDPGIATEIEECLSIIVAGANDDPQIRIMFDDIATDPGVRIADYPVMKMKVRRVNETDPLKGEIFFLTDKSNAPKAGNSFTFDYDNSLEWQYVTIDFSKNPRCRDYLTGIRFDVFDHAPEGGELEVEWITFFQSAEAAGKFDGNFALTDPATDQPSPVSTVAPATDVPAASDPASVSTADPSGAATVSSDATPSGGPGKNENGRTKGMNPGVWIVGGSAVAIAAAAIAAVLVRKKHKK